jgi:acyl carrier protein
MSKRGLEKNRSSNNIIICAKKIHPLNNLGRSPYQRFLGWHQLTKVIRCDKFKYLLELLARVSEPHLMLENTEMSTTLERLKQLFVAKFDSNVEELNPATSLEYLGLDSLDMVDFMFDIENEFEIRIPDQEFRVRTIQEIVDAVDRFVSEQRIGVSGDRP